MTIIDDVLEDLNTQIEVISNYKHCEEIKSSEVTPLWWTHRYDCILVAGFCEYKGSTYRFQKVFSDPSADIDLVALQEITEEQKQKEVDRIHDWETMVGYHRSLVGEPGSWVVKEKGKLDSAQIIAANNYYKKYFDDKHISYKDNIDYTKNKFLYVFSLGTGEVVPRIV